MCLISGGDGVANVYMGDHTNIIVWFLLKICMCDFGLWYMGGFG